MYLPVNRNSVRHTRTKVICDFDGTVTLFDTTDALLERFALPEWEDVEKKWLSGSITSRECMERQIAMIHAKRQELDAYIDTFESTPGFKEFVNFCDQSDLDLHIVSDGIDYTIHRVLSNIGLLNIPVFANHLVFMEKGYGLTFPFAKDDCRFGMCKCDVADIGNGETILIGDSYSDTCIAGMASTVYAVRGKPLELYCIEKGIAHIPFCDFYNILAELKHQPNRKRMKT